GVLDHRGGGRNGQLAVDGVVGGPEGGDQADGIADGQALDAWPHGVDLSGGLPSDAGGELHEAAAAEHGIRAVQAERPGADADLAPSGFADLDVLQGQDLGAAGGVEADDLAHVSGLPFKSGDGCDSSDPTVG